MRVRPPGEEVAMARKRVINIRHPELTDEQWGLLATLLPEPQASPCRRTGYARS